MPLLSINIDIFSHFNEYIPTTGGCIARSRSLRTPALDQHHGASHNFRSDA